jgi:hypothetical protein
VVQLRPGDLVAVEKGGLYVLTAILSKQVLFGGHWTFMFHGAHQNQPSTATARESRSGFNAVVDFIVPKRDGRITRISRGNDFTELNGSQLLQQAPLAGEKNYRIWRWKSNDRDEAEFVRFTPSPSAEERSAPHYSCVAADFAWDLAGRGWMPDTSMWNTPN